MPSVDKEKLLTPSQQQAADAAKLAEAAGWKFTEKRTGERGKPVEYTLENNGISAQWSMKSGRSWILRIDGVVGGHGEANELGLPTLFVGKTVTDIVEAAVKRLGQDEVFVAFESVNNRELSFYEGKLKTAKDRERELLEVMNGRGIRR